MIYKTNLTLISLINLKMMINNWLIIKCLILKYYIKHFNIGDKVLYYNNSNFTDDIWSAIIIYYDSHKNYTSEPQNINTMYVSNNLRVLKHRQSDINDDFITEVWQNQIENYKNYMIKTSLYD